MFQASASQEKGDPIWSSPESGTHNPNVYYDRIVVQASCCTKKCGRCLLWVRGREGAVIAGALLADKWLAGNDAVANLRVYILRPARSQ